MMLAAAAAMLLLSVRRARTPPLVS